MSEDLVLEPTIPESIQGRNLWQPLEEETENRFLQYRKQSAWLQGSRLPLHEEAIVPKGHISIKVSFSSKLQNVPEVSGDVYVSLEQETQKEGLRFINFVQGRWIDDEPGLYIFELDDQRFSLKTPIEIFVERTDDLYLVYNEALNISGHGPNIDEAKKDFEAYLIDNYLFYLGQTENNLSEAAKKLLEDYNAVLEKK